MLPRNVTHRPFADVRLGFRGAAIPAPSPATSGYVITDSGGSYTLSAPSTGVGQGRKDLASRDMGFISQSTYIEDISGMRISASGRYWAHAIGLASGDVLTGAWIYHTAGGAGTTLYKMGLYDAAGNRLAVSANIIANGAIAAAYVFFPFTAPYTVITSGVYYIAVLGLWGGGPTWPMSGSNAGPPIADVAITGEAPWYYTAAGAADLTDPLNFAIVTTVPGTIGINYCGVY